MILLIGLIITIIVIIIVAYYYYYYTTPSKEEDNNEEEEKTSSINEKQKTSSKEEDQFELTYDNSIQVGWNNGENKFGSGHSRDWQKAAVISEGKYSSKNDIVAIMNKNLTSYNASNPGTLTFFLKDGKLHANVHKPKSCAKMNTMFNFCSERNYDNVLFDDSRNYFYFFLTDQLAKIFGLKPKRQKYYENHDKIKEIKMGYHYIFGPVTDIKEISKKIQL